MEKIIWIIDDTKRCCTCKEYKPFSEYHKDKRGVSGMTFSCKPCANSRSRANHASRQTDTKYRTAKKDSYIRYTFGISLDEYNQRLKDQDYCCKICKTKDPVGGWHLDHNHTTGALRDFLCSSCNRGLGCMYENIRSLRNAIEYLERHNEDGNRKAGP